MPYGNLDLQLEMCKIGCLFFFFFGTWKVLAVELIAVRQKHLKKYSQKLLLEFYLINFLKLVDTYPSTFTVTVSFVR